MSATSRRKAGEGLAGYILNWGVLVGMSGGILEVLRIFAGEGKGLLGGGVQRQQKLIDCLIAGVGR